jgi:hypothetical protein
MTDSNETLDRPRLYKVGSFPLEALSPKAFEQFIYGCLLCIDDLLGIEITGNPSGPGDGGFDLEGRVLSTGRVVCVQCKRQLQPLTRHQVAIELAKVAATSMLGKSNVGQHWFICTGGVSIQLRNLSREESRTEMAVEAAEQLVSGQNPELSSLRKRLEAAGYDPKTVAISYVKNLDLLVTWDKLELDSALSPRWSKVIEVVERYFELESLVHEYPRALFDKERYTAEHASFAPVIELRWSSAALPEEMKVATSPGSRLSNASVQGDIAASIVELHHLPAGALVLLLGNGGAGKSIALASARAKALRDKANHVLPVMIALANYVPGDLYRLIHEELDVQHGFWHTLPDPVLLLCDGLNECPPDNVGALLAELKPLLTRKRITCVISTRESARQKSVVLPQLPAACFALEAITLTSIRAMAGHELHDGSDDDFVSAYRSLIDRSGSSQLWTPFAVAMALELWVGNRTLPTNLSNLLRVLLRSRCVRNSELTGSHVNDDVVLLLAGALAYECLVVDKRLECPAVEAGRWIAAAKKHCLDAFGVQSMTDQDVFSLLNKYELLRPSGRGHYGFGHQLIAGALAAPLLAHCWKQNLSSLAHSIVDDVWVFAAPIIAREESEAFCAALFKADSRLGARAARELPAEYHSFAENLLRRAIAAENKEDIRIQGLFGLGQLGTPDAVATLRNVLSDLSGELKHCAKRALAFAGDREFLTRILRKIDEMNEFPATFSGGETDVLAAAPLSVKIELARERLFNTTPGTPVSESMFLLGYEGEASDAPLLERHLRANRRNMKAWHRGMLALHRISRARAKALLDETLLTVAEPHQQGRLMTVAALVGIDIDLHVAFACALSQTLLQGEDRGASVDFDQFVSSVFPRFVLNAELISQIERELRSSIGECRARLWKIASYCESSSIAEYAAQSIEAWNADRCYACDFFVRQPVLANTFLVRLINACEIGFENEEIWFDWHSARAIELMGELGWSAKATDQLSKMFSRLARVRLAVNREEIESLCRADAALLDDSGRVTPRYGLNYMQALLVGSAVKARPYISDENLLSLLHFDARTFGCEGQRRLLLSGVSDALIDTELPTIIDRTCQLSSIALACSRGASKIRLQLLAGHLRDSIGIPSHLTILCEAIEASWSRETCEMVTTTIAKIDEWPQNKTQSFWDIVAIVDAKISPVDEDVFRAALLRAKTPFAIRILQLWLDRTMGVRIG